MILTKTQAEAVYIAAREITKAGGRMQIRWAAAIRDPITVVFHTGNSIRIVHSDSIGGDPVDSETYASQADFATAYNLS